MTSRLMTYLGRCALSLATVALLVTVQLSPAAAIPPGGASSDTPGTSSRISPRTTTAGSRIAFAVAGFPARQTLYIKINDGALCTDSSHGACVYHTQRISSSGTASGYLTLPGSLKAGTYWLRFLASDWVDSDDHSKGTKGYTLRSASFKVVKGSASGGTATAAADSTAAPIAAEGVDTVAIGSTATPTPAAAVAAPTLTPAPADGATPARAISVSATGGTSLVQVGADLAAEWVFVRVDGRPQGWHLVSDQGEVEVPVSGTVFSVLDVEADLLGVATVVAEPATTATVASSESSLAPAGETSVPGSPAAGLSTVGAVTLAASVVVAVGSLAGGLLVRRRRRVAAAA